MSSPAEIGLLPNLSMPDLTRKEFLRIRELAQEKFGLELRDGKEKLVASRLAKHVRAGGFRNFNDYVQHVVEDRTGESLINLINALSTNHTSFFREMRHFDFLVSRILPQHAARDMRIWSAACATGEEPYSIAMAILEQPAAQRPRSFTIIASDISTRVLDTAKRGIYGADRVEDIPAVLRSKYFEQTRVPEQQYTAGPELRRCVEFRRINLMDRFDAQQPFDLIFCRNVMIYFNRSTQRDLVRRLADCLQAGGHLLVGHSESLTALEHSLEYVEPAIYRKPQAGEHRGGRIR